MWEYLLEDWSIGISIDLISPKGIKAALRVSSSTYGGRFPKIVNELSVNYRILLIVWSWNDKF